MPLDKTYLGHQLLQGSPDDPVSIFNSAENLVGRADNEREAMKVARQNRIKELVEELYAVINLRD